MTEDVILLHKIIGRLTELDSQNRAIIIVLNKRLDEVEAQLTKLIRRRPVKSKPITRTIHIKDLQQQIKALQRENSELHKFMDHKI